MVKHNNVVPNVHGHKHWQLRIKTWFDQPAQKRIRRNRRRLKAEEVSPRPSNGPLRPFVHCQGKRYNMKIRLGRGFSLAELKEAKLNPDFARTIGIAVDPRRHNKSEESLHRNVERLNNYRSHLIIQARNPTKPDKTATGNASEMKQVDLRDNFNSISGSRIHDTEDVELVNLTNDMKSNKAFSQLRQAQADAKYAGKRSVRKARKLVREEKLARTGA